MMHSITLPVDDPFWNEHHPGDRWNCKCSLEATDEPVNRPDDLEETKPHRGLENNPGKDGKIFNETHPYFPKNCYSCPFNKGFRNRATSFFNTGEKDCQGCRKIDAKLPTKENEYKRLLADPNYKDVQYDPKTGAIKAMHVGHNVHKNDKTRYFGNMTGDDLENECCSNVFRLGHTVIGRKEMTVKEVINKQVLYKRELDIKMDGRLMDIASLTKNKDSYEYTLLHKNKQLFDFNNQHEDKADTVLLYFHDPSFYTEAKIKRSIEKLKMLHKYAVDENGNVIKDENGKSVLSNELYDIYIKHVIVVTNDLQWKEFDV